MSTAKSVLRLSSCSLSNKYLFLIDCMLMVAMQIVLTCSQL